MIKQKKGLTTNIRSGLKKIPSRTTVGLAKDKHRAPPLMYLHIKHVSLSIKQKKKTTQPSGEEECDIDCKKDQTLKGPAVIKLFFIPYSAEHGIY